MKVILIVLIFAVSTAVFAYRYLGDRGKLRIACVGDSITYGMGLAEPDKESFPSQLAKLLPDSVAVANFGFSGATVLAQGDLPYRSLKPFTLAKLYQADIVLIQLGTNDIKPQNWKFHSQFETDYQALIDVFKAQSNQPEIWLVIPPPVLYTQAGISEDRLVTELIPRLYALAKRNGLPVINLHTLLKGEDDLFSDGVHPNKAGAKRIAEHVFSLIVNN